jgi:hypothetical protein
MLLKRSTMVLVLLMLLAGIATASASAANVKKPGDEGYVVTHENGLGSGTIMPMSSSGSIRQGETQWRTSYVSGFTTTLNIGLYWGNPSNSLRMRVYAPDGSVFGPYYDNCDGRLNGFIPFTLYRSSGIPQGTYYIEIYGDRVNGVQSYTVY